MRKTGKKQTHGVWTPATNKAKQKSCSNDQQEKGRENKQISEHLLPPPKKTPGFLNG